MLHKTFASIVLLLTFALSVTSLQFITGPCASDAECASACCGFKSGKCAGPVIAQERDGGCGFGNAQPNDNAAQAFRSGMAAQNSQAAAGTTMAVTPAPTSSTTSTGNTGSGKAPGTQFITGQCSADADCASGCCGFRSGKCAGPVIAQSRDGGCGFGNSSPNADAARAFGFTGAAGSA